MTMPHLENCLHQGKGWCLDCVGELHAELTDLREYKSNVENRGAFPTLTNDSFRNLEENNTP